MTISKIFRFWSIKFWETVDMFFNRSFYYNVSVMNHDRILSKNVSQWWNDFRVVYTDNPAFVEFHRRIVEIGINLLVANKLPLSNLALSDLLSNPQRMQSLVDSVSSASLDRQSCDNYLALDTCYREKILASIMPALQHKRAPDIRDYVA